MGQHVSYSQDLEEGSFWLNHAQIQGTGKIFRGLSGRWQGQAQGTVYCLLYSKGKKFKTILLHPSLAILGSYCSVDE